MSIDDSFMSFHMLCDQIQSDSSLTIKKDVIRAFVSRYTGDLGLLFKLLLPKQNGRLYHLQDKQLIKLFALALGQTETTLKNHLNGSGCIGLTASHFFKPRVPPLGNCQLNSKGICTLKLSDLDYYLEMLSAASGEAQQLNAIQKFLNVACRNALFTYLRSIKQDLSLGAGVRVVLEGLHPSANAVYKRCANIQEVVKKVQAGAVDVDDDDFDTLSNQSGQGGRAVSPATGVKKGYVEASITMFMPLAPMLASPSNGVDHVLMKTPNGAYSETKYDGERIQIHKQGTNFKFFARSLKPMKPDKYEGLEKYLVEAVKADSCILDGEILLVDIATSKPLPFGTLGKHKKTQFSTACTCIFLFDIMYKDGKTLLDVPMDARREYLKSSVQFIQNRVMISEMRVVSGTAPERKSIMQKHLQFAVAEGLEGLVIKDIKSLYEPGSRHWIKLKKDYLQGMADSADLIVLGAWYGSGNKGGVLSTFLMGVWDKTVTGGFKQFKTVVKVGNGHDDMTLAKLNTYFKTSGRMIPGGPGVAPPPWLDINTSHYPDVYIKPIPHADVWEISAAEFSQTKTHTANGVSMRFPRVTKIRDDKDLNTATSLQELVNLMQVSSIKGSKLDALGAHQHAHSDDDEEQEGAREKGVMMRTSSRYDGPIAVVPGQHFGPLSPKTIEELKKHTPAQGAAVSSLMHPNPVSFNPAMPKHQQDELMQFIAGPSPAAQMAPPQAPLRLKQTPYWVFRSRGFKGDTPPPMPTDEEPDAPTTGSIEYFQGDVAQPRSTPAHPHQSTLLIHCCAVGPGMKWSQRGTMGTLGKFIGDEPEEAYTSYLATGEASVGDAILVECSNIKNKGRLFVATILGQVGGAGGVPQVDQDAFEKALLVHLLPFAKAHLCAVHIPKLDRNTGANWGLVDKILRYTYSRQHNLRVSVYQKGALAGDGMSRQDTAMPSQVGVSNSLVRDPSGALPIHLQRSATAAPALPSGFTRVGTTAPLAPTLPEPTFSFPPSVEDQFNALPPPPPPTMNATASITAHPATLSQLLAKTKACLFTVEGVRGEMAEPPAAQQLRSVLVSMGAAVLPHCLFGEDERALVLASATHIVLPLAFKASAFPEASEVLLELMSEMRSNGGAAVIVRGEWVLECHHKGVVLSTEDYGLNKKVTANPSATSTKKPPNRPLPLVGRAMVVIGGTAEERTQLIGMAQSLGAIVQDSLRMTESSRGMGEMVMIATGAVVPIPLVKTSCVLVIPVTKSESAPTDSFREGSSGSLMAVPLRTVNTTVYMASKADVEGVSKALSLGVNVLMHTWMDDCFQRYTQHATASLPNDGDYYVDFVKLYEDGVVNSASAQSLGAKRPRDSTTPVPSMPPTPLTKVTAVGFEPATKVPPPPVIALSNPAFTANLPPFLLPASTLTLSLHGYGSHESGVLLQKLGELKSVVGGNGSAYSISLEANLNIFGLKSHSQHQRILICEVLTTTSLPLLKGVAASCKRASLEPLTYLDDYRSATIVTSGWVDACLSAKAIVPVEPFVYRPPAAFGVSNAPSATPQKTASVKAPLPPTPPLRASPAATVIEDENDNVHSVGDGESTDTASYCTLQALASDGAVTEEED